MLHHVRAQTQLQGAEFKVKNSRNLNLRPINEIPFLGTQVPVIKNIKLEVIPAKAPAKMYKVARKKRVI